MLRAFLLSLLITSNVYPFDLGAENRVPNGGTGYCAWACVESLARYHKLDRMYNFVSTRPFDYGVLQVVVYRINARGYAVGYQPEGADNQILKDYANTLGVVCGIRVPLKDRIGYHAIVVTYYDDKWVEFYDPNVTTAEFRTTRQAFDSVFTGWAIVIFPPGKQPPVKLIRQEPAFDSRRYTESYFSRT